MTDSADDIQLTCSTLEPNTNTQSSSTILHWPFRLLAFSIVVWLCCHPQGFASIQPHLQESMDELTELAKLTGNESEDETIKKQMLVELLSEVAFKRKKIAVGQDRIDTLFKVYPRLIDTVLMLDIEKKEKAKHLQRILSSIRSIEEVRKRRFESGIGRPDEYFHASAVRIETQLQLIDLINNSSENSESQLTQKEGHERYTADNHDNSIDKLVSRFSSDVPLVVTKEFLEVENSKNNVGNKESLKRRIVALLALKIDHHRKRVLAGRDSAITLLDDFRRINTATQQLECDIGARIKYLNLARRYVSELESDQKRRYESGLGMPFEYYHAIELRLQIEMQLAKAKLAVEPDQDSAKTNESYKAMRQEILRLHQEEIDYFMNRAAPGGNITLRLLEPVKKAVLYKHETALITEEKITVLEMGLKLMGQLEMTVKKQLNSGVGSPDELFEVRYFRLLFQLLNLRATNNPGDAPQDRNGFPSHSAL